MKNQQNATTVERKLGAATAMHRARLGAQVLGRFATQREQAPSPQPFLEPAYEKCRRALRLVLSPLSMFNLNAHSS